ncbi:hypothetical protein GJAV_G00245510 [Gymnothorax javanicus]|nr:hypothetical protein GJAV_G00245510 [Gymnothorax javanicus]
MSSFLHILLSPLLIAVLHAVPVVCNGRGDNGPNHKEKNGDLAAEKMRTLNENMGRNTYGNIIRDMEDLENTLEATSFKGDRLSLSEGRLVAHLYRARENFQGLNISANEMAASSVSGEVKNSSVHVHLPKTLLSPQDYKQIVFCMITATNMFENVTVLYDRVVGLSISNMKLTGLTDRIKITFSLQKPLQEHESPQCHFLNFSTESFHGDGCLTHWNKEEDEVVCSCDHMTYFAVLLVNPKISEKDRTVLTYISLIGCSISLFCLVITLIVYIGHRKMLADTSLKVHLNLVVALILLNGHFLPSQQAASLSVSGPCIYLAVMLHYSLLATFSWMAIEGFHLYLLLVRVFNIYIKRYLLKLGLVGWGLPAVVVAVILIIDKDIYQRMDLHPSDNRMDSSQICYLQNRAVQIFNVTFCGVVWASGMIMLARTCRLMLSLRRDRVPGGKSRSWKDIGTILGISCLLGITWALVFCSFGRLPTPAVYLFCILNSLQGLFLSLWLCISKLRTGPVSRKDSQATKSTDIQMN